MIYSQFYVYFMLVTFIPSDISITYFPKSFLSKSAYVIWCDISNETLKFNEFPYLARNDQTSYLFLYVYIWTLILQFWNNYYFLIIINLNNIQYLKIKEIHSIGSFLFNFFLKFSKKPIWTEYHFKSNTSSYRILTLTHLKSYGKLTINCIYSRYLEANDHQFGFKYNDIICS